MKYLVIFLSLIGFAGFITNIHAELDQSIAEPFKNNDMVLIGKIIQVNSLVSENKTEYNIQVEEYLKGQKPFDMITAILDQKIPDDFPKDPLDYYNKPYFEKENQVFVYLKQVDGTYKVSPYSFTLNKPTVAGPPTVIHPTGPQAHILSQGDEIVISGNIKKAYLYSLEESNLDSSFNLVILNEKDELVESEKLTIFLDGSYMFSFQDEGEVRIPGKYSWEIKYWNGGMGGEFIVETVPSLWTPLKQFKSGVSINEIQCKEGLEKLLKYNGSPVCVKPTSVQKLLNRGFMHVPIGASFHVEKDCNDIDARKEAQCFKDAFETCTFAQSNAVIYTIEGDAMYLEAIIKADCKIHVTFDNSGDKFGGPGKGITNDICTNVELQEKYIWIIGQCARAEQPEFQINYLAQDFAETQARNSELIERFESLPEVNAFYAKYDDANVSVRDDHLSYFSGREDDLLVRMNLFFEENYELHHIDFHCYYQNTHLVEIAQEDIVYHLENRDCK